MDAMKQGMRSYMRMYDYFLTHSKNQTATHTRKNEEQTVTGNQII